MDVVPVSWELRGVGMEPEEERWRGDMNETNGGVSVYGGGHL